MATGRRVDLSELGLGSVGLDGSARRLETDERMRVAEGLWAIGDVTGQAMLTDVALYQGAIAVADILDRPHPPARYDAVLRAVFTDPEVGAVGLTEAEARTAGLDVAVATKQLPATFRGWLHATAEAGIVKLVVDRDGGRLVGATAVGPHGAETMGMHSLAVHAGVTLAGLRSMICAFTTFHGAIGEAIGADGRGVTSVLDPVYEGLAALDGVDPATASRRPRE